MAVTWGYLTRLARRTDVSIALPRGLMLGMKERVYSRDELRALTRSLKATGYYREGYDPTFPFCITKLSFEFCTHYWEQSLMSHYDAMRWLFLWTVMYRVPLEDVPLFLEPTEAFRRVEHTGYPEMWVVIQATAKWRLTIGR